MMSGTHLLRQMVNARLAAAAEEIFGLVEKTIAEYQDEVFRSRREVIALKRQMEQLSVLKPEVQLLKIDSQESAMALSYQNPTLEDRDTPYHEQAEEEQLDLSSSSDPEDPDCYEDYQAPLSDSDLTCPTFTVSTMTFKVEEPWNEVDHSISPSCDLMYSDVPFTVKKRARRDKMKKPVQRAKTQYKECRLCHISFQTYAKLKRHMDTNHMGEKAYICTHCNRGFDQEYQMAVHLRIHTGEKPYSCEFCGKTFAQNSNRIVHLRQHTGERPYYCVRCGKNVSSSNHLKWCGVKQNIERRKKAYRCKTCGKRFSTSLDLEVHKEVHKSWKRHLEEKQQVSETQ